MFRVFSGGEYMRVVVLKMNSFWGGVLKKLFKIKD
jgi:hypothetical protein